MAATATQAKLLEERMEHLDREVASVVERLSAARDQLHQIDRRELRVLGELEQVDKRKLQAALYLASTVAYDMPVNPLEGMREAHAKLARELDKR